MDIIRNKARDSVKLMDRFRDFFNDFRQGFRKLRSEKVLQFKNMIFDIYPENRDKLLARVEAFNLEAFLELEPEDQQKLIFQLYYLLEQFNDTISEIYQSIEDYSFKSSPDINSELTYNTVHKIILREQYVRDGYIKYEKDYGKKAHIHITKYLSQKIIDSIKEVNMDKIEEQISNINQLFRKYPITIDLYAQSMKDMLYNPHYRSARQLILSLVEEDKAFVLQPTAAMRAVKSTKKGKQNPFLRGFGLVPSRKFRTLNELFPKIIKKESASDAAFKKIAKETKTSIILLQNITSNPVSHELWDLIDIGRTKNLDLSESKNPGLTVNMINKTKTICILTPDKKKWIFSSYKLFGQLDSNKFYIIETPNNKSYRFLAPWVTMQMVEGKENNLVPRHKINGLLNYLGILDKSKISEIDRIVIYQKNHAKALEKMFLIGERPDMKDLIVNSRMEIDAVKIQDKCWFNIKKIVQSIIKTVKNPFEQIGTVVYDDRIFDTFVETINDFFMKYYKKIERIDEEYLKLPFSEVFSTYLHDIGKVRNDFYKALQNEYRKRENENRAEMDSLTSKVKLMIYIEKIIKAALQELVSNDQNIYQEMAFKYNIFRVGVTRDR